MKLSVYGFLLSSSLLSTHIIFADSSPDATSVTSAVAKAATETELSDSFDGFTQPEQGFTSKDTDNEAGTTYTLKADISFANIISLTTATEQPPRTVSGNSEGSCFTNTKGDLSFAGDSHSLEFINIFLKGQGAAISHTAKDKTLKLSNISDLTFASAPSPGAIAEGKGTIFCQGSSLQVKDNTNVVFSSNHSTENGGTICYAPPPHLSRNRNLL
ncbi:hypothetical protein [Chlamydia abortus]|uniref:hypothetical protein n=1 Tax=Chlamydia abortus TaxID=83555 RepID=UPI0002DE8E40|nr:hypothetical protein [Chlamydia abortus]SFW03821.1 chlamydia polymorphic membrane family protein [Chlamydia abortus]